MGEVDLGIAFSKGAGVGQDDAEAMKWWQTAANQNNARGQYYLGMAYARGIYTPQDDVQADMWLRLSAAQNYQDAVNTLPAVEKDMRPEQLEQAKELARNWKQRTSAPPPSAPSPAPATVLTSDSPPLDTP
jgi:TPR repeat protein